MDEYLFLIAAKLKADRLKLEREQREAAHPEQRPTSAPAPDPAPSRHPFIPLFSWR
jgi:hypothetical protein